MHLGWLAVVATAGFVGNSLWAQWVGSIADPSIRLTELTRMDSLEAQLTLTPPQRDRISQIVADIESRHLALVKRFEALGDADRKLSGDASAVKAPERGRIFEERMAIGEASRVLNRQLNDQIAAALGPEQAEHWNRLVRAHRRATTLKRGASLIAEGVDLVLICERCLTEQSDQVADALHEYAVLIDELLVKRNQLLIEREQEHYEKMRDGVYERVGDRFRAMVAAAGASTKEELRQVQDEHAKIVRRERVERLRPEYELRMRIQAINAEFFQRLSFLAADEEADCIGDEYRTEAYARYPVYSALTADHFLAAVCASPSLDSASCEQIESIRRSEYEPTRIVLSDALAQAYLEWERSWESRTLGTRDHDLQDEIVTLHRRRQELQRQVIDRIYRVAPADVIAHIPMPEVRDEPRMDVIE